MLTIIRSSIVPLLVFLSACTATQAPADRLAQIVAEDSAQFAAVVDSLQASYLGHGKYGITPVPLDHDSVTLSQALGVPNAMPLVAARRAVLVAKQVRILDDASAGTCPPIFSDEQASARCPAEPETRIGVSLARQAISLAWGKTDSTLAPSAMAMGTIIIELGRGGHAVVSESYLLERVGGQWLVTRVVPLWAT